MRLRLTREAARNLDEIFAFVAARNPGAAGRIVEAIEAVFVTISEFPSSGRLLESAGDVRLRGVPGHPYVIFYRLRGDAVQVLRVRDGRRRPEPLP